jgi:hypothetical protein
MMPVNVHFTPAATNNNNATQGGVGCHPAPLSQTSLSQQSGTALPGLVSSPPRRIITTTTTTTTTTTNRHRHRHRNVIEQQQIEISSVMDDISVDDDDDDDDDDSSSRNLDSSIAVVTRSLSSSISSSISSSSSQQQQQQQRFPTGISASSSISSSLTTTNITAPPRILQSSTTSGNPFINNHGNVPNFYSHNRQQQQQQHHHHHWKAVEDAKRVIFHPANNPPTVHEFDWKVTFKPATTSGTKRRHSSIDDIEHSLSKMDIVKEEEKDGSNNNFARGRATFWNNQRSKKKKTTETQTTTTTTQTATGNNSNSQRASWNFGIPSLGRANKKNHSDNISITSDDSTTSTNSFLRFMKRPTKRTKTESQYHLGPVSESSGILKNPTSVPDSIPTATTTNNNDVPNFAFSIGQSLPNQQRQQQQPSSARNTTAGRRKNKNKSNTTTTKRLRFVDSRMKVVKRLQTGNIFNFGTPTNSQQYQEMDDDDDDDDDDDTIVTDNENDSKFRNRGIATFSFGTPSPYEERIRGAQKIQSGTIPIDWVSSSSTATPIPEFSPTMAEF